MSSRPTKASPPRPPELVTEAKKLARAKSSVSKGRKKQLCPQCGGVAVPIIYGEFSDPALIRKARTGKIVVGGCCLLGKDPNWHCVACSHEWIGDRHPGK